MKKILFTVAMAAIGMTAFAQNKATAQQTQNYFRVEFTMPIIPDGSGVTAVSAGMKDDYTYHNPLHQYLDFAAGGNLKAVGTVGNMGFRTIGSVSETSVFYLDNGRTTWTTPGNTAKANYPYQVDKIKKITSYSIPVEQVKLIDSTATHEITFIGNNKKYKVSEFTFNRLPRNVAELKTLIEDGNGTRVEACKNPLFVAAVMYLVCPRLLDCSQDCWEMINYLCGVQYTQLNTVGFANTHFQDVCIGMYSGNGYKDGNGFYTHNVLFQHFAGATPGNQYKPNGKDYWTGPYKVRVGWSVISPTEHSGQLNATIANVLLMPNPDATSIADISFEDPTAHNVKLRSTNKNGWFMHDNLKTYFQKGKDQRDDDF
jgi:hypothetical protein